MEQKIYFWKIDLENAHQKLVPDPFLILVNNQKTVIACKEKGPGTSLFTWPGLPMAVFELFQKLHLLIYANQFIAS